ncbi:MAG: ABC transporter ATP-binding protein [Burkholderiaceae bacterium]|nr:ABC transporter ATP-binding protein [Burkholderiaceae bacterium]
MLELAGIDSSFGKKQVLRGLSLKVGDGEVVALIGPNAAGKSTTLRTIIGSKRPTAGSTTFGGKPIDGMSTRERVREGLVLVPEGRQVFTRFTVLQNLQMGAYLRPDRDQIAADLEVVFELFPRLAERRAQQAGSMSGGEQQMLAIARGLLGKPKLLLMDEPSLGLAPIVLEEIARSIHKLARQGLSILLAEQNASFALRIADRGYVIESGAIRLEGDAKQLSNEPAVRENYLGH